MGPERGKAGSAHANCLLRFTRKFAREQTCDHARALPLWIMKAVRIQTRPSISPCLDRSSRLFHGLSWNMATLPSRRFENLSRSSFLLTETLMPGPLSERFRSETTRWWNVNLQDVKFFFTIIDQNNNSYKKRNNRHPFIVFFFNLWLTSHLPSFLDNYILW